MPHESALYKSIIIHIDSNQCQCLGLLGLRPTDTQSNMTQVQFVIHGQRAMVLISSDLIEVTIEVTV